MTQCYLQVLLISLRRAGKSPPTFRKEFLAESRGGGGVRRFRCSQHWSCAPAHLAVPSLQKSRDAPGQRDTKAVAVLGTTPPGLLLHSGSSWGEAGAHLPGRCSPASPVSELVAGQGADTPRKCTYSSGEVEAGSDVPSLGLRRGPSRGRCWGHPRMPQGGVSTAHPDRGKEPTGAILSPPSQCWRRRSPYKREVGTTSPGQVSGRGETVQSWQGGFTPWSVQHGDTGGRMSRALFVMSPLQAGTSSALETSVSPHGAPVLGTWWHWVSGPQCLDGPGCSSPRPDSTALWSACGGCAPHISQCRCSCWKPSPFPQPTHHSAARLLPKSWYSSSSSLHTRPSSALCLWFEESSWSSGHWRGAGDSGGLDQGGRAGGRNGASRRQEKGLEEKAESVVLVSVSIYPASWVAEDALVADGLWALSPALNPLIGCQGEVTLAGDDTGNRSSVHTGL